MKPNLQPSIQRLRALAAQLRRGEDYITDWDCYYTCKDNPFLWSQLKGLVLEPVQAQIDEAKAKELQAQKDLITFKGLLRRTCCRRRDDLAIRADLHSNIYPQYLEVMAEIEAKRQHRAQQIRRGNKAWDRFLVSAKEYRCHQAASWTAREDLPAVTQLIWTNPPYQLVSSWPIGSRCPIDPEPVAYKPIARPPVIPAGNAPPTIINVVRTDLDKARIRQEAENLFLLWQAGMQPLKNITTTTTDEQGTRTSYSPDDNHTVYFTKPSEDQEPKED